MLYWLHMKTQDAWDGNKVITVKIAPQCPYGCGRDRLVGGWVHGN